MAVGERVAIRGRESGDAGWSFYPLARIPGKKNPTAADRRTKSFHVPEAFMQWTRIVPRAALAVGGSLFLALACRDASSPTDRAVAAPSTSTPRAATTASTELVDILRDKMNRFRDFANAAGGGYTAQITNCLADPT